MKESIQHTIFYPHPPEMVWEYLTRPELIELWLMKNDFKAEVGHEFEFTTKPLPQFNFDGHMYCKVLELVPAKKLTYSWKGGPGDGSLTLDSLVKWELRAVNDGTELSLVHSGFGKPEAQIAFMPMNIGWEKNMQKIATLINPNANVTTQA